MAKLVGHREDAGNTEHGTQHSEDLEQEVARPHAVRGLGQIAVLVRHALDIAPLHRADKGGAFAAVLAQRKCQRKHPHLADKQVDDELALPHEPFGLVDHHMKPVADLWQIDQRYLVVDVEIERSADGVDLRKMLADAGQPRFGVPSRALIGPYHSPDGLGPFRDELSQSGLRGCIKHRRQRAAGQNGADHEAQASYGADETAPFADDRRNRPKPDDATKRQRFLFRICRRDHAFDCGDSVRQQFLEPDVPTIPDQGVERSYSACRLQRPGSSKQDGIKAGPAGPISAGHRHLLPGCTYTRYFHSP